MKSPFISCVAVLAIASAPLIVPLSPASASPGHNKELVGGKPGKRADATRTVVIVATDNAFNKKRLSVRVGQTVRFIVVNRGEEVHELTLGTVSVQKKHQKEMLKMMDKGMMPGQMNHSDPNSVTVKPGERKEIIWTFARTAKFEFGCNIPGHYESGMRGQITIR